MGEFGGANALTQARGRWLLERIVETGSAVLSVVGGDHAGTTAAHRDLNAPQSSVSTILSAPCERTAAACRGRWVVAMRRRSQERATARQRNPHRSGSLAWLSWIAARFGGWNCYGKPPAPRIMDRGWDRFAATLAGALMAQDDAKPV